MKHIHVTAIRFVNGYCLKCERVDLHFESTKQLEAHRDNLLKVFTNIYYTYDYE